MKPLPILQMQRSRDLNGFINTSEKLRKEKRIVVDLRHNPGGTGSYAKGWFTNLIKNKLFYFMGGCDVYLPSLNQFKRMYCSMSNEPLPTKNINNPFTGQLYIITDKRVSSGGECFAILGKQYENAVFIGENTRGVINYGNVDQLLTLQNSKLRLNVATSKFAFPIKITEGIGIIPDYWLDGEDAIGAIKTLEKGRKNYEKKFKRETKSKECENQKIK